MDGVINAEYLCLQLSHNQQVAWEDDQCHSCLVAGGQLGPGKYLLAAPHLVNLVPAGPVDFELKLRNLLGQGQDGNPSQEQDDGGALVAQWKHGEAVNITYYGNCQIHKGYLLVFRDLYLSFSCLFQGNQKLDFSSSTEN